MKLNKTMFVSVIATLVFAVAQIKSSAQMPGETLLVNVTAEAVGTNAAKITAEVYEGGAPLGKPAAFLSEGQRAEMTLRSGAGGDIVVRFTAPAAGKYGVSVSRK
ncbi:MAG: hypothetical protein WC421_08170 [Elusimicrobiales bacterium]